jgi:hypothetical protein
MEDFTMKELTIEEIKTRNKQEIEHLEDIIEMLEAKKAVRESIWPEQLKLLKEAFESHDFNDWERCRVELEIFLGYEESGNIFLLDVSKWNYRHILRWFRMLTFTGLGDDIEEASVQMFSQRINYQVIKKMPQELKHKLENIFNTVFPEIDDMFNNSPAYSEDGQECIRICDAVNFFGVSGKEIIQALNEAESGEFLLTENQIHKLQ